MLKSSQIKWFSGAFTAFAAVALVGCETSETAEVVETVVEKPAWTKGAMVAAADPRAVEAGLEVLRQGGHAVDAAIAVHAVLGLVEPQSSGIGGGAFMVVYDRASDQTIVYDGRETAPSDIDENLFMQDGEVLNYISSWQSGIATGVPSTIALYEAAHDAHGQLAWDGLFDSAITLADDGFVVQPRLASFLTNERLLSFTMLDDYPASSAYFFPDGEPLQVGDVRDNPDYAETLRAVATGGADAFYEGEIAEAIVAAVAEEPRPGTLSLEDIANYEIIVREPLCGAWRAYTICSAPPPSSGGITQNMIAGLYDRLLPEGAQDEDAYLKAFVDAQRLAYADRDHYVADADMVMVPTEQLIDPAYLDVRATEAFEPAALPTPGDPGLVLGTGSIVGMWGQDPTEDAPGTTHLSIVDNYGNVVSMTATVESIFGTSRLVKGFFLNNELTDFAREPTKNGKPVANAPAPGKRPRSSMSPTIIFDEAGEPKLVTGSPGGNSIVAYTAKTVLGVLDWGKTPQEAIELPNIVARGPKVNVEIDRPGGPEAAEALRQMGYDVLEREGENSGLHTILVTEDGLEGGADPRREGVAVALE
ncbi:MAG: gamma-glutamyltransferase [Henriciella sp.]|nr:gamma-glutamyltransferase [Henriciella sp.]